VFESDETGAVQQVLASGRVNYWTGDQCRALEAAWNAYHPGVHSMAMANGSLTMDAALRALGIGPGDEVIVAPRTYVASAMCVALAGATPVFADVDPDSGCITPATAEAVRTQRTKAVIPVHIGGWPCDMPAFERWAQQHGIHILEDCAQAHGARIGDRPVGTWGTFASWSFCQDKIMTTGGEGGMLATTDLALWKRVWAFAQHGKDHDRAHEQPTGPAANGAHFRWIVDHEGTNLRMTEMQAAIGIRQLAKLDQWVAARARNSAIMRDALRTISWLRVPEPPAGHAHYRCVAFVAGDLPHAAQQRDSALAALRAAEVPALYGSCSEVYREGFFASRGYAPPAPLPNAHRLGETSLTFLVHHTIDEQAMRRYAGAVRTTLAALAV
jgi:dTDP-4-amino-4,6-dideoxygalactose transaminase